MIAQRDHGLTTIRVGTFASAGSQLLPRAIRELRARMEVQVEVVEAEPIDVVDLLHAGDLHAGLIYDSAENHAFATPDLEFTVLIEEHYRVLVARDSHYAGLAEIDFADPRRRRLDLPWRRDETSDRVLRAPATPPGSNRPC